MRRRCPQSFIARLRLRVSGKLLVKQKGKLEIRTADKGGENAGYGNSCEGRDWLASFLGKVPLDKSKRISIR